MKHSHGTILHACLGFSMLLGCSRVSPVPAIALVDGAQNVEVLDRVGGAPAPVDPSCGFVRQIVVDDGRVSSGRLDFRGSVDRATIHLRNEVFRAGGDTAQVESILESLTPPDASGSVVSIHARAYRCR